MEDEEKVVAKTTVNKKTSTTNKTTPKVTTKTTAKKTAKKTEEVLEKDSVAFNKLQEENKAMQEQMKQMEKMMRELSDKMVEVKPSPVTAKTEYGDVEKELQANEYVKVVSLVDGLLNLWTEPNHKGRLYGFNKFGQQKDIQYSDVAGILDNQEKFVNQGCFYVLDKRVIERHYLSEAYETFLNKEMIERLLESDSKSDYKLFKSTSDKQKEIIIRLYIEKVYNLEEDEIDFNKIEFFTKNSGKNVKEMLEEFKSAKSDK